MLTSLRGGIIMNINLFRFALEKLEHSDWDAFEKLSSAFLATDFPDLRTMAHSSGDGGRDSELFTTEKQKIIAFQYSVQKDWKDKINKTVRRIATEFPDVRLITYLTSQQIGAQADEIKKELLGKGYSLDVRDRSWFLERAEIGDNRIAAAERLIDRIARPYLASEQVINKPSASLTSQEARAALLYLGLQWQDDITEKGLTKLSFDALVRAALRHTHADSRITRTQIHDTIKKYLPTADSKQIEQQINAALGRLTKRYIRYYPTSDEFCLMHEEHQRIIAKLAENESEEIEFNEDIVLHCQKCLDGVAEAGERDVEDLRNRIPRVIDRLLLKRGEAFVSAVMKGQLDRIGFESLTDIIIQDLHSKRPKSKIIEHLPKIIQTVVRSLLAQPRESTHKHLRRLSSSYTLFSFLRETPDVQSATKKLFSHGIVWLDTTVLLPLFSEQLEEDESHRKFTRLLTTARHAGIELRVTPGVISEVISHMKIALTCSQYRSSEWRGRIPYLYYQFLQTGKSRSEFAKWLLLFRGQERSEDDVAQFLLDTFGIQKIGLSDESRKVDDELRYAAERLWTEAHHERRKQHLAGGDEFVARQLIEHDLETYLGVIALRQQEHVSELGYKHWLLTMDSIAWQIRNQLRSEFKDRTPPSPLLSLDFLVNNLTFGPERRHLTKSQEEMLPIVLDVEMAESMPQDILEIADKVRKENEDLPEYVIRRKVRDAIDQARRRRGCFGKNGIFDQSN